MSRKRRTIIMIILLLDVDSIMKMGKLFLHEEILILGITQGGGGGGLHSSIIPYESNKL